MLRCYFPFQNPNKSDSLLIAFNSELSVHLIRPAELCQWRAVCAFLFSSFNGIVCCWYVVVSRFCCVFFFWLDQSIAIPFNLDVLFFCFFLFLKFLISSGILLRFENPTWTFLSFNSIDANCCHFLSTHSQIKRNFCKKNHSMREFFRPNIHAFHVLSRPTYSMYINSHFSREKLGISIDYFDVYFSVIKNSVRIICLLLYSNISKWTERKKKCVHSVWYRWIKYSFPNGWKCFLAFVSV